METYLPRLADGPIADLLAVFPALLVTGPRSIGKTTTALRQARSVLRMDRPLEARVAREDPDALLRGLDEPVLIDEWQMAPEILGAVKRAVDVDSRPGRFIVTGSVRSSRDPVTWPGTGRLIEVGMYSLTQREIAGRTDGRSFLTRLLAGELDHPRDPPDLRDYVEFALRSGFPEAALGKSPAAGRRWLSSYLERVVVRDALEIADRDPTRLRRYVDVIALNSAGTPTTATLLQAAGIARDTAVAYDRLLADLALAESIPAWWTNRLKRLATAPKRYLTDAGLMGVSIGVDVNAVLRDADLLGRLIDTFASAQIRPELALDADQPRLHHLRTRDGREVDMLIEFPGGRIVGVEVKAAGAVTARDARHLAWLRDQLGERFLAGVVLHTGPRVHRISDRITAAPLATLWSGS